MAYIPLVLDTFLSRLYQARLTGPCSNTPIGLCLVTRRCHDDDAELLLGLELQLGC